MIFKPKYAIFIYRLYLFVSFYTPFSVLFVFSLDKKLINLHSKRDEQFIDFLRPLVGGVGSKE